MKRSSPWLLLLIRMLGSKGSQITRNSGFWNVIKIQHWPFRVDPGSAPMILSSHFENKGLDFLLDFLSTWFLFWVEIFVQCFLNRRPICFILYHVKHLGSANQPQSVVLRWQVNQSIYRTPALKRPIMKDQDPLTWVLCPLLARLRVGVEVPDSPVLGFLWIWREFKWL